MKSKKRGGKNQRQNKDSGLIEGIIRTKEKGFGFIDIDDKNSIYIPKEGMERALDGDTVKVKIVRKFGDKTDGKVMEVVKRRTLFFVGTLLPHRLGWTFVPDNKRIIFRFLLPQNRIPKEFENKLNTEIKVQVKLGEWLKDSIEPEVSLTKILGKKGDNNTEMESIVLESGFQTGFSEEIEKEAKKIKAESSSEINSEISKRRDFRQTWTCTIDPEDAKDFDDAISFEKKGADLYEIGVHIADVSHYVRPGTELDREALERGCSIYLVDRTIPMLPEILSNDLCSLNPHQDKMVFSAVFLMNSNGHVKEKWFGKGIIKSAKRFTYETAQEAITNPNAENHETLKILNEIAKKLKAEKSKNGAIEFETEEIKFKLDAKGFPIGVYKKVRFDAHKLVEEFMLLANKEVARFIWEHVRKDTAKHKGLYRIHDIPDPEKISNLGEFIRSLGHQLHVEDGEISPLEINRLLARIEGRPEADVIRTAIIRSMQKAIYSTKNIGHFGLGFTHYTHFTSPIRRYPDLIIHRILETQLKNGKPTEKELSELEKIAEHSTEREIRAAEAERSSIKYKQVEFMMDKVGKEFEGVISGVTEWGIYIEEKETKCEGLIHIRALGNEFFKYDKGTASLTAEKSGKKWRLGEKVKFKVAGADLEKKTLDYVLI